jgi:hypothetical protein
MEEFPDRSRLARSLDDEEARSAERASQVIVSDAAQSFARPFRKLATSLEILPFVRVPLHSAPLELREQQGRLVRA